MTITIDELSHEGTKRHSGRYPWGSGKDPQQRGKSFLGYVKNLEDEGMSELEIAKGLGIKTTELRARKSMIKTELREDNRRQALRLKTKGYSHVEIGKRMGGYNESTIREWLDDEKHERAMVTNNVAGVLRNAVKEHKYIDVGVGTEIHMGLNRHKLKQAVALLKEEGYKVQYLSQVQAGTGKKTSLMVLTGPDTPHTEIYQKGAKYKIRMVDQRFDINGYVIPVMPVVNVDGKRVAIRYHEDGGSLKDGVIELRRGVADTSLGNSKYAQVRIGVDGTHYLKGMAMYTDDAFPKGVDIVYNTSKTKDIPRTAVRVPGGPKPDEVFKPMEKNKDGTIDTHNPFGSAIKPGGQKGVLNIVNEEGDWVVWSKNISSQVLSKQSDSLAKKQLKLAFELKKEEFDEINSLTNPTLKKRLLETFADESDSAAIHLKAAALPRQDTHIILPITSIKENEVYAPKYNNGDRVVLIRHPHGGIFEIPELTVNNKNPQANNLIKDARDAIGIHPKVAERLSGADFDGDTVIVIPNKEKLIRSSAPLKDLQNFNPKKSYPLDSKIEGLSPKGKQLKMGDISNLITDMTIKGATESEIARAVKHSMVVIDAEKHHLDYKKSYTDHSIGELKAKYQNKVTGGASTLISRAKSETRIPHQVEEYTVNNITGKKQYTHRTDPVTGKRIMVDSNESFVVKGKDGELGKTIKRTTKLTKMEKESDAYNLSSGTTKEAVYAEHANALKQLANKARLVYLKTGDIEYSPSANKTYAHEVSVLKAKLKVAYMNKPLERQAQLLADMIYQAKKEAHLDLEKSEIKKLKGQALEEARARMGAGKKKILITDREWEAIQLGAIHKDTLGQILLNTDIDLLKERAMPRTTKGMSPARILRAQGMRSLGYTAAEIASALGVSVSTLERAL
jgi:hypothetical protein